MQARTHPDTGWAPIKPCKQLHLNQNQLVKAAHAKDAQHSAVHGHLTEVFLAPSQVEGQLVGVLVAACPWVDIAGVGVEVPEPLKHLRLGSPAAKHPVIWEWQSTGRLWLETCSWQGTRATSTPS